MDKNGDWCTREEVGENDSQDDVHPRDDDEHTAGHIDGEKVIGELSLEGQIHRQAAVLPCIKVTHDKELEKILSFQSIPFESFDV